MSESSFLHPTEVLEACGVHAGMRVADLSAAGGFFARAAARLVAPSEVWAVDPDQGLLDRLKHLAQAEQLNNVEVMRGDIERINGSHLPERSFDMALLVNALFAARHKDAVLAEAARVLKGDGRLLLVDWSSSHGGLGPHETHVLTEEAAEVLWEDAGFARMGRVPAGAYHWGVILKKK